MVRLTSTAADSTSNITAVASRLVCARTGMHGAEYPVHLGMATWGFTRWEHLLARLRRMRGESKNVRCFLRVKTVLNKQGPVRDGRSLFLLDTAVVFSRGATYLPHPNKSPKGEAHCGAQQCLISHEMSLRACLNLFRPGWNGWNGTRLLVVVLSIPTCLCPFRVSGQPSNRPEQIITQLTIAAGPHSSTQRQGCRHVGSEGC